MGDGLIPGLALSWANGKITLDEALVTAYTAGWEAGRRTDEAVEVGE